MLEQWSGCHSVMDDCISWGTISPVLQETENSNGQNTLEISFFFTLKKLLTRKLGLVR